MNMFFFFFLEGYKRRRLQRHFTVLTMSALSTPSTWLIQTIVTVQLSNDNLYVLITGIFTGGNTTFECRDTDAVVLKLTYSVKQENLVDKFGEWKELIRVVPLSPHHTEDQGRRFLQLIAERPVFPTSPENQQAGSSSGSETQSQGRQKFRLDMPPNKRFRDFM